MTATLKVNDFTADQLLDDDTYTVLSDMDDIERAKYRIQLKYRAKSFGLAADVDNLFKAWLAEEKKMKKEWKKEQSEYLEDIGLEYDEKGKPVPSIENFVMILRNDERFANLRFNELAYRPEKIDKKGKIVNWADADDAETRRYIESRYGLYNPNKLDDALRIKFEENSYNPIKDIIESVEWDGVERIETFLTKHLKVENSEYSREVGRLIFAGGINRLYRPGCKFDDMVVLIGKKQGEGKSTIVRWLALQDEFFREVGEINGKDGMEVLEGAWICEMSELLALTKTKEVEAVKSYIAKICDVHRRAYDRRITEHKRQCIFIGTTNKERFLTDKTGNRRYYPVVVNTTGYELFKNEKEIRADILQCWAEAKAKLDQGKMPACANSELLPQIQEAQGGAVEDDYRDDLIKDYLSTKLEVCIMELWVKALDNPGKPSKKDSNEISLIIQSTGEWKRESSPKRFPEFGMSKYFSRILPESAKDDDDVPFK